MDKSMNESIDEEKDDDKDEFAMSEFGINIKAKNDEKDLRDVYIKNYGV